MLKSFLESVSEEVHNAWWEEKKKQGFHAPCEHEGDGKFNPVFDKFTKVCDKCHTDMYPYEELPENVKEYDRVTVRAVVGAIKKLGYEISKYCECDSEG